jgi:prepilin-type N-terminal cleavage/methylation domain-containing protein
MKTIKYEVERTPLSPGLRPAFTLIELLVVIAIIAILAGLLIPVLSRAKEKARSIQCINRIKQWHTAFYSYTLDNDDWIPREGFIRTGQVKRDKWANVQDSNNQDSWYNALPKYLDQPPASAYASRMTGQRPKFYQNRLFHCPSAKFKDRVERDNDAFFSLAMNSKLIMGYSMNRQRASIKFGSIQEPARTVTFLDGRSSLFEYKVHTRQADTDYGQPSAFATRFAARHLKSGNLGFADGQVCSFRGVDVVETRSGRPSGFAIYPDGKMIWTADPLTDPNRKY